MSSEVCPIGLKACFPTFLWRRVRYLVGSLPRLFGQAGSGVGVARGCCLFYHGTGSNSWSWILVGGPLRSRSLVRRGSVFSVD